MQSGITPPVIWQISLHPANSIYIRGSKCKTTSLKNSGFGGHSKFGRQLDKIKKKYELLHLSVLSESVSEGLSLKDCLVEGSTSNPFYCFFFNLNYMIFANVLYNFSLYYNSYCIWL